MCLADSAAASCIDCCHRSASSLQQSRYFPVVGRRCSTESDESSKGSARDRCKAAAMDCMRQGRDCFPDLATIRWRPTGFAHLESSYCLHCSLCSPLSTDHLDCPCYFGARNAVRLASMALLDLPLLQDLRAAFPSTQGEGYATSVRANSNDTTAGQPLMAAACFGTEGKQSFQRSGGCELCIRPALPSTERDPHMLSSRSPCLLMSCLCPIVAARGRALTAPSQSGTAVGDEQPAQTTALS